MAVRDGARDSEPERVDHQHHVLQDPIPTQDKAPRDVKFHDIDWFRPTTWELKADHSTSLSKGVLADAVNDVGKAAQAMKIWAAEADTAMRNADNEYISFKMQMDDQQQRADNLHATMKEEIMKKDKVRLKLMNEASLADGPTLHFNQNDLMEKNWHKDEPDQVYTLESLGLEDAQEAAELQDDRDATIQRFKEQNEPNHNENDWVRLLDTGKPMRRAENADSPFTVAGVQALKEKAEREDEELNCDNALQDVCLQPNVENTHCKANPSFRDGCRLACGLCPNKELTKKFKESNKRKQQSAVQMWQVPNMAGSAYFGQQRSQRFGHGQQMGQQRLGVSSMMYNPNSSYHSSVASYGSSSEEGIECDEDAEEDDCGEGYECLDSFCEEMD